MRLEREAGDKAAAKSGAKLIIISTASTAIHVLLVIIYISRTAYFKIITTNFWDAVRLEREAGDKAAAKSGANDRYTNTISKDL